MTDRPCFCLQYFTNVNCVNFCIKVYIHVIHDKYLWPGHYHSVSKSQLSLPSIMFSFLIITSPCSHYHVSFLIDSIVQAIVYFSCDANRTNAPVDIKNQHTFFS